MVSVEEMIAALNSPIIPEKEKEDTEDTELSVSSILDRLDRLENLVGGTQTPAAPVIPDYFSSLLEG